MVLVGQYSSMNMFCVLFLKYRFNAWFSLAFGAIYIVAGGGESVVLFTAGASVRFNDKHSTIR